MPRPCRPLFLSAFRAAASPTFPSFAAARPRPEPTSVPRPFGRDQNARSGIDPRAICPLPLLGECAPFPAAGPSGHPGGRPAAPSAPAPPAGARFPPGPGRKKGPFWGGECYYPCEANGAYRRRGPGGRKRLAEGGTGRKVRRCCITMHKTGTEKSGRCGRLRGAAGAVGGGGQPFLPSRGGAHRAAGRIGKDRAGFHQRHGHLSQRARGRGRPCPARRWIRSRSPRSGTRALRPSTRSSFRAGSTCPSTRIRRWRSGTLSPRTSRPRDQTVSAILLVYKEAADRRLSDRPAKRRGCSRSSPRSRTRPPPRRRPRLPPPQSRRPPSPPSSCAGVGRGGGGRPDRGADRRGGRRDRVRRPAARRAAQRMSRSGLFAAAPAVLSKPENRPKSAPIPSRSGRFSLDFAAFSTLILPAGRGAGSFSSALPAAGRRSPAAGRRTRPPRTPDTSSGWWLKGSAGRSISCRSSRRGDPLRRRPPGRAGC